MCVCNRFSKGGRTHDLGRCQHLVAAMADKRRKLHRTDSNESVVFVSGPGGDLPKSSTFSRPATQLRYCMNNL